MVIYSTLSPKEYLAAAKSNMSSTFDFGMERFTGFFAGRLFYITHHCGYEWDRKINNPKNAAMGFVKKSDEGCNVHFIIFRGAMCPLVFLPCLIFMLILGIFRGSVNGTLQSIKWNIVLALIVTTVLAPISAFIESTTMRSEDGKRALLSMLINPEDPMANYNKV